MEKLLIGAKLAEFLLLGEDIGQQGAVIGSGLVAQEFRNLHDRRVERREREVPEDSLEGVRRKECVFQVAGIQGSLELVKVALAGDSRHQFQEKSLVPEAASETFGGVGSKSVQFFDSNHAPLRRKKEHTSFAKNKAELTGRRVLLAEDMEVNAQIMMEVLKMRGLEAELALNGREALEMFRGHPEDYYDAILMDVRMPEMDGLEATEAIRKLERPDAKQIPIIALTANAFDEDVQRSLQAGMNAHLSKPIQPEVLYKTLEELL